MTTNYARGRQFEYKVIQHLKKSWPLVVRSAGSKGPVDIVAVNPDSGRVALVSCKKAGYWKAKELNDLDDLDTKSVTVFLAYMNTQGNLEIGNLRG